MSNSDYGNYGIITKWDNKLVRNGVTTLVGGFNPFEKY